jgi:hypothetical protein
MPLAKPTGTAPVVVNAAKVETVGDSETIKETRESTRVAGQIRTHLVAHAMPSLLSTIDLTDSDKVKALISEYTKFVETGK